MPLPRIAPLKEHLIVLEGHQPLIANGHAMRIPAQVGDYLAWASKRRLRVDDPVVRPELVKPGGKGPHGGQRGGRSTELEALLRKGLVQPGQVFGPEDRGERPDRKQKIPAFRRHPPLSVRIEGATSHNAVDME